MQMPNEQFCSFTPLENNVWKFIFLSSSTQAVDDWLAWQDYLKFNKAHQGIDIIRMVMDFRPVGPVPMLYGVQKSLEWRRKNTDVEHYPVKVAILLKTLNVFERNYGELLKEGLNLFGMGKIRFKLFTTYHQQATDWLLKL